MFDDIPDLTVDEKEVHSDVENVFGEHVFQERRGTRSRRRKSRSGRSPKSPSSKPKKCITSRDQHS